MEFKRIVLLLTLIIGLASLLIHIFFNNLLPYFLYSFVFWWMLVFYFICAWNLHLASGFTLRLAFTFFLLSGIFTTVYLKEFGEFLIRCSLLLWIIGLIQSLIEYKKIKIKTF